MSIVLDRAVLEMPGELTLDLERARMSLEDDVVLQDLDDRIQELMGELVAVQRDEERHRNRANRFDDVVAEQRVLIDDLEWWRVYANSTASSVSALKNEVKEIKGQVKQRDGYVADCF